MRYRDRLGRHVDVVQYDEVNGKPVFMAEIAEVRGEVLTVVKLIDPIIGESALTLTALKEGWGGEPYNCPFCGTPGVRQGISHACN